MTFGLGSGIAGIAGVALSQLTNVGPNLGQSYIIDSFMVVVFGGVGNLLGTLVAAFTLGIATKFLEPTTGRFSRRFWCWCLLFSLFKNVLKDSFHKKEGGRMTRLTAWFSEGADGKHTCHLW